MSPLQILQAIQQKQVLADEQAQVIRSFEESKPFSLHWELRTILYAGVTLLSSGLGILIYKNIDTIGHSILIALIGLISAACFWYVWKHRKPFSRQLVETDSPFADYALLLGCLTFLTMEGYWQYQYNVFGQRYGLVTAIPALLFLALAYRFDHRGVLSMGLTAFASWVGVTVTPLDVLKNNFSDTSLITASLGIGVLFLGAGWLSERYDFKKHFSFTYFFLGGNIALVASLAGLIGYGQVVYMPPLVAFSAAYVWYARHTQSFIFLLIGTLCAYIGFTYVFFTIVLSDSTDLIFWVGQLYFVVSAVLAIIFFLSYKKLLGKKP